MLETLSNWFYDPYVFWGVPVVIALIREALTTLTGRGTNLRR